MKHWAKSARNGSTERSGFFDKVNAEDKFVVEGIHRGSNSPLARPGPFSWLEREIHDFARYLDRKLNGAEPVSR